MFKMHHEHMLHLTMCLMKFECVLELHETRFCQNNPDLRE